MTLLVETTLNKVMNLIGGVFFCCCFKFYYTSSKNHKINIYHNFSYQILEIPRNRKKIKKKNNLNKFTCVIISSQLHAAFKNMNVLGIHKLQIGCNMQTKRNTLQYKCITVQHNEMHFQLKCIIFFVFLFYLFCFLFLHKKSML